MGGAGKNLQNALKPLLEIEHDRDGRIVRRELGIIDGPLLGTADDQWNGGKQLPTVFLNEGRRRCAYRNDKIELSFFEQRRQVIDHRTQFIRLLETGALQRSF